MLRLMNDVMSVLPTTVIERGKDPSAGKLLPRRSSDGEFSCRIGTTHGLFLWSVNANSWIVLTSDNDKYVEKISDYSRIRVLPIGESETPWLTLLSSVVMSWWTLPWVEWADARRKKSDPLYAGLSGIDLRPWPDDDVWPARTSFQRTSCNSGGTCQTSDRAKLPMWRPALRIHLHHHATWLFTLTLHLKGEHHERLAYGQIEWFPDADHFWVSMETDRIDRLKFGSGILHCQTMSWRGNTRIVPCKWRLCRRVTDIFEWPDNVSRYTSPEDLRNIRDETFPVSRDESDDKANLRDRLSIQSPNWWRLPVSREHPNDLRTLWIEYDAHDVDTKLDGISLARHLLRSTGIDVFHDGRCVLLYMSKHFEKHGG